MFMCLGIPGISSPVDSGYAVLKENLRNNVVSLSVGPVRPRRFVPILIVLNGPLSEVVSTRIFTAMILFFTYLDCN